MKKILEGLQEELNEYHDNSVLDNDSRLIVHDEKYIYLYLKESGVLEKASYTPELYHFMARPSCCSYSYDYKKDRVQVELMAHQKSGKRYKPALGAFLQRWYHNKLTVEDFLNVVSTETSEVSVDHANADKHNHCHWNLSDVTISQNSRKGTLSYQIKPPYFCYIAVTPNNEYRVFWGYSCNVFPLVGQYWICRDIDSLIDFLGAIMRIEKAPALIKQSGTPKDIWGREPGAYCASENFPRTAKYVELLLSMDDSEFNVWTVEKP